MGRAGRLLVLLVAMAAVPAWAQPAPPAVSLQVVVEPRDSGEWHALFEDVLLTPDGLARPLLLGLTGATGGDRWVTLTGASFTTRSVIGGRGRGFRVVIIGKVAGIENLRALVAFEQAVLDMQAGMIPSRVTLSYGLAIAVAELIEMQVARP